MSSSAAAKSYSLAQSSKLNTWVVEAANKEITWPSDAFVLEDIEGSPRFEYSNPGSHTSTSYLSRQPAGRLDEVNMYFEPILSVLLSNFFTYSRSFHLLSGTYIRTPQVWRAHRPRLDQSKSDSGIA